MKMLLPAASLIAALGLAPRAWAIPAALEADLDQKSGKVLTQSEAYRQVVKEVKWNMALDRSSSVSEQDTARLLKAMSGVKDSIGDLLGVLVSHANELKPDDKNFDTFVSNLQSRSHELAEAIDELEHPPLRGLPPPSAFITHRH
jgi:hypothetical protein